MGIGCNRFLSLFEMGCKGADLYTIHTTTTYQKVWKSKPGSTVHKDQSESLLYTPKKHPPATSTSAPRPAPR